MREVGGGEGKPQNVPQAGGIFDEYSNFSAGPFFVSLLYVLITIMINLYTNHTTNDPLN